MTLSRTLLITCSLSQVHCAPLIYEIDERGTSEPSPVTGADEPTAATGEPPPTCDDGLENGSESDVDCGGPCSPCGPGQRCRGPEDCRDKACDMGVCVPFGCEGQEPCPPPGPCLRWDCDPKTGCAPTPDPEAEGQPCDDGLACTVGERCVAGECTGGKPQPVAPLLATDFSLADGWELDPLWQIGPAKPSKCSEKLADDPPDDHSPGLDGQLAGAQIGGCLPLKGFPPGCLTSPPLVPGDPPPELWLRYWSVLNTAGAPMDSHIDVLDPEHGWLRVAEFPEFTAEPAWTEHILDLTPFITPGLRVRFCHGAAGPVPAVGGWSLDDISLGPALCD